jgi:hypothetical protein
LVDRVNCGALSPIEIIISSVYLRAIVTNRVLGHDT